jgi:copper(I)-binding protein
VVRSSGKTVAKGLLIGAVALLISGIAGCEAGNNAPTLEFHPASTGASTTFNGISINDVFVLGAPLGATVPAGSSARLFLSLYNGGTGDDELTGVHATGWASSVQVTGGTVSIPLESEVNLTGPQPQLVLSDLAKPLSGGEAIPLTLDFAHAGSVTLDVPVEAQSYYFSSYSPPPIVAPSASATATATPTASGTATPTASGTATATP